MKTMTATLAASLAIATGACATPSANEPVTTLPASVMVEVRGTAAYRERIALLPGAVMVVRVEDVSRADAPSIILAERSYATDGHQVPIPFSLEVPRAAINGAHRTNVRVVILSAQGELLWTTDTHYPVEINSGPLGADMGNLLLVRVNR